MRKLALSAAIATTLLMGCGGGGGGSDTPPPPPPPTPRSYEITAIDGYLRNALAWLDLDADGVLDEGEPSARTGVGGVAVLNVTLIQGEPTAYPVVVRAIAGETIDEARPGSPITTNFTLTAPAGVAVITPYTTLLAAHMAANAELSLAAAADELAETLGIPASVLLSDYVEGEHGMAIAVASNITPIVGDLDPAELSQATSRVSAVAAAIEQVFESLSGQLGDDFDPTQIVVTLDDSGAPTVGYGTGADSVALWDMANWDNSNWN